MKLLLLLAGFLFLVEAGVAQPSYPNRTITTVVGFAPGGGTDTVSRIIAKTLGEQLRVVKQANITAN
jgi:tripartite-type tricarboxylate transporter receptor subunit TctC